jgi:tape measure domain-containing protein
MAAQDAELKLKVSLDLAFFRQQLAGLGQAAAGYKIPVQVQLDRRSVQNELNALGRNISQRNYRLNIETNLKQEIKNARDLAAVLKDISTGASGTVSRRGGTFRQELGAVDTGTLRAVYKEAARAGLLAFDEEISASKSKIITQLNQVATDASQGFLNAFSKENSRLRKAAGDYGNVLLEGLRKTLKISSPSREMFNIGEDAGKGFELGLVKAMDIAEQSATRKMQRMLDRLARMALMMSGMGGGEISRQAGQLRGAGLPGPSWTATVPPSQGGGYGGGRMLPPGPTFTALGGTAFGAQKYLPTALSDELKQILRGAAYAFVDSLKQQVRSTRVGLGASQQPLLGASRIAGMLPAGVGRQANVYSTGRIGGETQSQLFARREREARMRSALREVDVLGATSRGSQPYSYAYRGARPLNAIVPYAAGGALVPGGAGGGGGGGGGGGNRGGGGSFFGGMGDFGRAAGGLNLPGAGTIRELGQEFSFAAKQVLLFGTAYKALAFITDFPSQVGNAVGQLQTFKNTLAAISPTAQEAAASNKLILDLVDRYNIPLQSARDGFTKLYASMAPAGFAGEEIRNLFTGISQAAATFGMSADKVDRVNYAFAQMASKGQVMSEELKGQLGDVLPGAMAIFAEAAGFKGPKAIQDFSAALEEGQYKGAAMVSLLKNVGIVMSKEFGPGAEGAARTFQGSINRMQNSLRLLYESFEPAAVGFLNSVVLPMTNGIKQLSDGLQAFFSGTTAKTAGGGAIAKELEALKPAFDGIAQNIRSVIPVLQQFGSIALQVAKTLAQIAGNPVVGYLAKLYLVALPLNIIFNSIVGSIGRVIVAMTSLNVGLLAGAQRFTTYRILMDATGRSASQLSVALRAMAPALNFATVALRAIAAPAILFGISLLIERFMMLKGAVDGVAQSTKQMLAGISGMANAGAVRELQNVARDTQKQIQVFEQLRPYVSGGALGPQKQLTSQAAQKMRDLGMQSFVGKDVFGKNYVTDFSNASKIIEARLQGLRKTAASVQEKMPLAQRVAQDIANQTKPAATIQEITGGEGEGGAGRKLQPYDRSRLEIIQQTFDKEKQILDTRLLEEKISQTGYNVALANLTLVKEKAEIEEAYRLKVLETNRDNISAVDKQLKLADLQLARTKELENAEGRKTLAVKKATEDIRGPFKDALRDTNIEIEKSTTEIDNLRRGYAGLTPEQEANFRIEELTKNLRADEYRAIQDTINALREKFKIQAETNQLVEQERNLSQTRAQIGTAGQGLMAGFYGGAAQTFENALMQSNGDRGYATQMAELETQSMRLQTVFGGIQNAIGGIGDAFGTLMTEGIASMIEGTATAQEVFSGFLNAIGQALQQAAAQMIATYIAIGIARIFAGMGGGGGGLEARNASGNAAFMDRVGKLDLAGSSYANGGIAVGGFKAFANGGVVQGPTLGLVGEGKYNEAIVPLPDGRSIPVQMQGDSIRDKMGGSSNGGAMASPVLSMNFETTTINNVEYVSRDQLEQAMMETRKLAVRDGARQGANLAIDKLQQSPNTRRRIGI